MELTPRQPSRKGPPQMFTGDVWLDAIVGPETPPGVNANIVHFAPGARTAWHSHEGGQTLYVTEGRGRVQSRGEPVVEIGPGDVVVTPDAEEHWHGAAQGHFMTHLSITHGGADWGDQVTDEEYGAGS